jgi:hypothetical protein
MANCTTPNNYFSIASVNAPLLVRLNANIYIAYLQPVYNGRPSERSSIPGKDTKIFFANMSRQVWDSLPMGTGEFFSEGEDHSPVPNAGVKNA